MPVEDDAAEEVQPDVTAEGSTPDEAAPVVVENAVDYDKIAKRIVSLLAFWRPGTLCRLTLQPMALKKLHPVFKQAKKSETMRLIKKMRCLK